jgi:hypothetical protein
MDALTAYSTLALVIFTLALFILAAVNYRKFIENVKLVSNGLDNQANSIKLQAEALKAQAKDILLNYKPVVFIKQVIQPPSAEQIYNPFNSTFVLTNSGKLTARNVKVDATINVIAGNILTVIDSFTKIFDKAVIYPNGELYFRIPPITLDRIDIDKAQIRFSISYMGDGLDQQLHENMKYIFTKSTNNIWIYVEPQEDIFFNEKFNRQKIKFADLSDFELSENRQRIIRQITGDIIGIDKVLALSADELIESFHIVANEIREMKYFRTHGLNAGAITGLWGVGLIEIDQRTLTSLGVSLFKCVAEIIQSDKNEFNQ